MKLIYKLLFSVFVAYVTIQNSFADFENGKTGFSIIINNEVYPYKEFAVYVLPKEPLGLCINANGADEYNVVAKSGELVKIDDCRWIWTAPADTGLTQLKISNESNADRMILNIFVMTPAGKIKNDTIEGIKIGRYPEALDNSPLYQKPDGFIRVAKDILATPVSPHFVLGQFVTPFDNKFPKYIVLRERLLLKLETLVERLNDLGYSAESLSIIAGYMTPAYNASIGQPEYSRHIYGGAATVIIDADADGRMDDLDKNGSIDDADVTILFNIIDDLYSEAGKEYLRGGLFLYTSTISSGPYIMLDARGYRKRWSSETPLPTLPDNLHPKHKRQFIQK